MAIFLVQHFLDYKLSSEFFEPVIVLLTYLEQIMAEKTKIGENSAPTNADLRYIILMPVHGHTLPAD